MGHLASTILPRLVLNTVILTGGVAILTTIIGVSLAWLTAVCEFPGRRTLSWLLLLPMAVPAYVMAFTFLGPEEPDDELPLAKLSNETFLKGLERQVKAKEILLRKINQRIITLAKNAAARKEHKFFPGEVVYAWRQGKRKDSKHRPHTSKGGIGPRSGQWYGPAVVLGTETTVNKSGPRRENIVWVFINGRLWRCAPSQLRPSTSKEQSIY